MANTTANDMKKLESLYGLDFDEIFKKDKEESKRTSTKMNQNKTLVGVYIMEIVRKYATPEKPMTQARISKILEDRFGLEIGRGAVNRTVHALSQTPFGLNYDRNKGVWFDKEKVHEF